nr:MULTISPECIES: RHS repeat-associated core domain-containing protein [unclassified Treponema]
MKFNICIFIDKHSFTFRTAIEAEILFAVCVIKKQALTGGKSLACEDKCSKKIGAALVQQADRRSFEASAVLTLVYFYIIMIIHKCQQSAAQSCLNKKLSLSKIPTDRTFENRRSRYKEPSKNKAEAYRVYVEHLFLRSDAGDARIFSKEMTHTDNQGDNDEQKAKRYYYHSDHLGSAQFVTDWKGRQYEHIEYTPYGELWIEEVAAGLDKLPFRFTGKELDEETGLYYYGARYLDPKYSRWLSGDPALNEYIPKAPIDDEAQKHNENLPGMGGVFNVVNLHVYHYAGNNPVKYIDPDGRDIILLNMSYGAYKEGHNAVLIGNDKTGGWLYFSKDGKNLTGSINKAEYFPTLESFIEHNKKLDTDEQYDRAYQVKTNAMNDSRMIAEGLDIYDKKYSLDEKRNEITLEVISQNCADLCADIGKKGGVNISKPKHSRFPVGTFTKPNFQYEDFKKNNKGEEIQIK